MQPQVLVIGAGPVGLTMAAELARFGIRVRIVDKAEHRSDKSKALVVWSRTLELFDRAGWTTSFLETGHPAKAISITSGGNRIARIDFTQVPSPHPYALMIPQSETERLLEEQLSILGVNVERSVEATQLSQTDDGVTITLQHGDGRDNGGAESCHADWVIGCDGAHSFIRHRLGLLFAGDTLPSHWVLADVHLSGVTLSSEEVHLFWHAEGTLVVFPIEPGRFRVIADVDQEPGQQAAAEPTLQSIQQLLDRRGPGGIRATDAVWLAAFSINERRVENYRIGRVFVAGDAAHVHSPAGGQGMNTGIQDACNLAWKLALVCQGVCPPDPLLDSYSIERTEIARQVLSQTGRLTTLAVLKNPTLQWARNQLAHLLLGFESIGHQAAEQVTELKVSYAYGPLVQKGTYGHEVPSPGQRAPIRPGEAPPTADHRPRFVLCGDSSQAVTQLIENYPRLLDPVLRPPISSGFVTLVRPDGYVATTDETSILKHIDAYLGSLAMTH